MDLMPLIEKIGIKSEPTAHIVAVFSILIIYVSIGIAAYFIAKKWLSRLVMKIAGRTANHWDDLMFDQTFFNRLAWLIVPIVVSSGISDMVWSYTPTVQKLLAIWIVMAATGLVSAVLDGANRIYESYPVSKNKPLRVFIQVIKIFLYFAAILILVSVFTGKSVLVLLGGLTVFASVLMLVFKDSILGLVAGIQLSANNMVCIGDWIYMPSAGADGDVLEINLTTVKVQNWDKTITTVPTYKLVSESFTNWRGMFESNGRRIKRSVNIDVNSIRYLTEEEIETLTKSSLLRGYMVKKWEEIKEFNASRCDKLDERRLTNIGTFREYLESWLVNNPDINHDMIMIVRQLQPGPTGLPLEIYCFSARQKWVEYEKVQSDVFDHVFAVMGLFHLRAFQYSGQLPYSEITGAETN